MAMVQEKTREVRFSMNVVKLKWRKVEKVLSPYLSLVARGANPP